LVLALPNATPEAVESQRKKTELAAEAEWLCLVG